MLLDRRVERIEKMLGIGIEDDGQWYVMIPFCSKEHCEMAKNNIKEMTGFDMSIHKVKL